MLNIFKKQKAIIFTDDLLNQLFRYALSLCHHEAQAYDLVQICCEKILRISETSKHNKPYMMSIIRNEFFDYYRRNQLELIKEDCMLQEEKDECHAVKGLEDFYIDQQHVDIVLANISPNERELLYLWAVEGFSMQEIAELTDVPRGTLLSRLSRLKTRLVSEFGHIFKQVS